MCFSFERQNQWVQCLPLVEWKYNTSYHAATRMTPFQEFYGKIPPSVVLYIPDVSKVQQVHQTLTVHMAILPNLK
jgi:hypothetical protein